GDWENLPHGLGRLGPRVSKPATSHQSLVPIKTESKWVAAEAEHTKEEVKKSGLEDAKEIDQVLGLSNRELNDTIEATLDDMISEASETKKSATTPKAPGKKKQQYRLDYKNSPYPNHPLPNPDACEEVHLILVGEHGAVVQPATIPPPSREVAGCGEVPDILDAILRTVLSANTSMGNSNKALAGLIAAFPHEDTIIDWNAVRLAAVKCVYDAIKCGGLANVKSSQIKKLLDIVFQQNIDRRAALIEEEKTGIPAELVGIEGLTKQQKAEEVSRIAKNPLTLDWIFEIKDTSKVMDELIKLPAVGIKTASCVILFNMRRPSFAVDTHVWRLCRYLGWAPVTANPNQTFNHCDLRVPDHLKYALHQLFICHGQKCHRCNAKTNAGTSEWNNSICVLEQLVTRMEAKKQPDY
ncbi:DNA glycosylase, partial [Amylocarpus encephaloides]